MLRALRYFVHVLLIRPFVLGFIGLNLIYRERLPSSGPAILVANHNSHLDAPVIMSFFPLKRLNKLRPVGARDYFFRYRILAWCATRLFRIIPINRDGFRPSDGDPLRECSGALDKNEILIIFPEGTRGTPGEFGPFKSGVSHLARRHPDIPVIPIFIRGLEKVLPKGAFFPVPFLCDVFVGNTIHWTGDKNIFLEIIRQEMLNLKNHHHLRTMVKHGMTHSSPLTNAMLESKYF